MCMMLMQDGASYLKDVDLEERRLQLLCLEVERHLMNKASNLPDEGMKSLLTNDRLVFVLL